MSTVIQAFKRKQEKIDAMHQCRRKGYVFFSMLRRVSFFIWQTEIVIWSIMPKMAELENLVKKQELAQKNVEFLNVDKVNVDVD